MTVSSHTIPATEPAARYRRWTADKNKQQMVCFTFEQTHDSSRRRRRTSGVSSGVCCSRLVFVPRKRSRSSGAM
jgi:hypothetical protein